METKDGEEDRISKLSNTLLIHVLSFLETRYSVRTSILSTRWKNLWACVPNLTFHLHSPPSYGFSNFIDRVLLLHDLPQIHTFTFTCNSIFDIKPNRLNSWISFAIKRHVHHLYIDFIHGLFFRPLNFPLSLFTCESLVDLTLGFNTCIVSNLPDSICFPNLKSLKIWVADPDDSLTENLFRSCPVLEVLFLRARLELDKDEDEDDEVIFNICTQSLRVLRLYLEADSYDERCCFGHEVVIDAPALDDLLLDDNFMACYSINNVSSSLAIVHVDIGLFFWPRIAECDCHNRVLELLGGISNVRSLYLSSTTLRVLGYAEDNDQLTLGNLTRLELGVVYLSKLLLDLLAKMPNLESLKLIMDHQAVYRNCYHEEEEEFYEIQRPPCLLSHLKVIEVDDFEGLESDLLLVEYFLKNAKVLNKMVIKNQNLVSVKVEVLKRLLMFPRGSKTCEIEARDLIANLQEIQKFTQHNVLDVTTKYKHEANKKSRFEEFEVDDFVWAVLTKDKFSTSKYNKLAARKIGPLQVVERIHQNAYRLKLPSHIRTSNVFDVEHLIPYYEDSFDEEHTNSRVYSLSRGDNDAVCIAEKYMTTRDHRKAH
ncbi:putative FBD-associated F-box protein At5g53635 [Camellia sinensis]|uniref:putative FBD-associated F-box protein At5g53635 n=1 Tax=Camellia sinensis TaxID=4442 RepID=UPI0010360E27|nr:putative FBD-associated F-box protein At5g53635 [Camellia sinensis]